MKRVLSLYLSIALLVSGLASNPHISIADASTPDGSSINSGDWLGVETNNRHQLYQLPIRASAPSLTYTLFMPAIVTPDCGDVTGQVIQSGQPLSGKDVTVFAYVRGVFGGRVQVPAYTATTDARGYFTLTCVTSTLTLESHRYGSYEYTAAVNGSSDLGQPEAWSTYAFTLTRAQSVLLPALTLETFHLVDPVSGTIQLPYTFVWTSTYPNFVNGSAVSLDFIGGFIIFGIRERYSINNIPADVFSVTVKPSDFNVNCLPQCELHLIIREPNGIGFSFVYPIRV